MFMDTVSGTMGSSNCGSGARGVLLSFRCSYAAIWKADIIVDGSKRVQARNFRRAFEGIVFVPVVDIIVSRIGDRNSFFGMVFCRVS